MRYETLRFVYVSVDRMVLLEIQRTYVTYFAFSVMNLSDFIFMIYIKIVINKTDVYSIVHFPEAPLA
jgi:hypothetical protein